MNDLEYIKKYHYKKEDDVKLIEVSPEECFGYNVLKVSLDWFDDNLIIQLIRLEEEEYKTFFLKRKKVIKILNEASLYKTVEKYSQKNLDELAQIKQTKTIQGTNIGANMVAHHDTEEQTAKTYREQRKKWKNL